MLSTIADMPPRWPAADGSETHVYTAYIHSGVYSVRKKNDMSLAGKLGEMQIIVSSQIVQIQKDKCIKCFLSCTESRIILHDLEVEG